MIRFNDYYWDESTIEEICITFESTNILIHHAYSDKDILFECKNCMKIALIEIYEDLIIESLTINELPDDNCISNGEFQAKKELLIHMVSGFVYRFYAEDIILKLAE